MPGFTNRLWSQRFPRCGLNSSSSPTDAYGNSPKFANSLGNEARCCLSTLLTRFLDGAPPPVCGLGAMDGWVGVPYFFQAQLSVPSITCSGMISSGIGSSAL